MRIVIRPTVQLGLDLQYPAPGPDEPGGGSLVFTSVLLVFQHVGY
jgi:hypothetical protein